MTADNDPPVDAVAASGEKRTTTHSTASAVPSPALLTAMTTEQFVLQSARGVITGEATSRITIYLGVLSSSLVAVGFLADHHSALVALLSTVVPVLLVLGFTTFVRLSQIGAEDVFHLAAMQRIRRGYLLLDPAAAHYFADLHAHRPDGNDRPTSRDDDVMAFLGLRARWYQLLFTAATTVGVVNSMLAGIAVALVLFESGLGYSVALPVALVVAALLFVGHVLFEHRMYRTT